MLLQLITRQAEAGHAQTITPFPGHISLRRNAPGAIQRQLAIAFNQHAEQAVFQHVKTEQVTFVDQQLNAIGILTGQRPIF
ncbi:hypothetical protein D3C78_1348170 [compost metagenome]